MTGAMATTEQSQQSPKQLERKAAAKEEIINTTSGARQTVDNAVFNARAVGKILLNPFNKEARADAINTAREEKAASGQRMAAIRGIGAQQADSMRASAKGMVPPSNASEAPHDTAAEPASHDAVAEPASHDAVAEPASHDAAAETASEGTPAAPAAEDREAL